MARFEWIHFVKFNLEYSYFFHFVGSLSFWWLREKTCLPERSPHKVTRLQDFSTIRSKHEEIVDASAKATVEVRLHGLLLYIIVLAWWHIGEQGISVYGFEYCLWVRPSHLDGLQSWPNIFFALSMNIGCGPNKFADVPAGLVDDRYYQCPASPQRPFSAFSGPIISWDGKDLDTLVWYNEISLVLHLRWAAASLLCLLVPYTTRLFLSFCAQGLSFLVRLESIFLAHTGPLLRKDSSFFSTSWSSFHC